MTDTYDRTDMTWQTLYNTNIHVTIDKRRSDQTRPDKIRLSRNDNHKSSITNQPQYKITTRQDTTRQEKARQVNTTQDTTRKDNTRKDKTTKDKTRQDHRQDLISSTVVPLSNLGVKTSQYKWQDKDKAKKDKTKSTHDKTNREDKGKTKRQGRDKAKTRETRTRQRQYRQGEGKTVQRQDERETL
jgi:hypothetical protein